MQTKKKITVKARKKDIEERIDDIINMTIDKKNNVHIYYSVKRFLLNRMVTDNEIRIVCKIRNKNA